MSVRLDRRRLPVATAFRELEGPGLGGVALFAGRVRPDRLGSGRVRALEYEVDRPVALARLRAIESDVRRRYGAARTVLWHRVGVVRVGEVAVLTGAACGHRAAAFAAARLLLEEVKRTVPIWKSVPGRPARRPPRRPRRRAGPAAG